MKPSIYRRVRRRATSHEAALAKKENNQEQTFFGEAMHKNFFQPAVSVLRKCENCEEEDKKVHRQPEKKEEEKLMKAEDKKEEDKIQKKEDRKAEDKIMRAGEKKEEDTIQKKEDPKKEDKLMRQPEKKEEDKIQKAEEKQEEEKVVQKKETSSSASTGKNVSNYIGSLNGKGKPLTAETNHFFSSKIGYDFSGVKVHTDKEAAASAKEVNAKAYAVGNNIVFNEGQYDTASGDGKKLLAHELAHVVQQKGGGQQQVNLEQLQRKVMYSSAAYTKEDPIPKIIGSGGKLGETYVTINGQKLSKKLDAIKTVFEAFNNNLSLSYDATSKTCKVDTSKLRIDISAAITLVTDPVNDKWSGRYPGRLVTGSAYCSALPAVNIEMLSKPSGGVALQKSVQVDEAQHFTDIIDVSEKHIEAFHSYLDNLTLKADKAADCPAKFAAEIGNKDIVMATAFADEWLAAVNKYDRPGGAHHYRSVTDARNCNLVTVTVSF